MRPRDAAGHLAGMLPGDELEVEEQEGPESTGRRRAFAAGPGGVTAVTAEEAAERIRTASAEGEGTLVWIDILRPAEADGTFLRDVLKFHPLPVEDCLYGKQNPKLERYPGYYFLVLYAGRVNPVRNRPAFYELHCFVGGTYLVTVRKESVREVRELMAQWRSAPRLFPTVGHLAHGLADALVDSYFPMIDHFGTRVAASETEVFDEPDEAMQHIMSLRRELLRFRGVVGPTRDVFASLLRRDLPFLNPDLMPYFQDVRDHAVRVTEEIDTLRDLLSTAVEAQFAVTSNKLNQTVRMMTAWSIILMSMALITGIYGMNFDRMPELGWRYGYFIVLAAMFAVGTSLVLFFRRRHWL
ncbi:MAG TPA: magnesium/cobalt transporter CorA [Longimicrobiales bacterium]